MDCAAPRRWLPEAGAGAQPPIVAISSGESAMRRASQLSSRCATELVPGMGSIIGERASSHASAICDGVARCRAAIAARAGFCCSMPPAPSGKYGR